MMSVAYIDRPERSRTQVKTRYSQKCLSVFLSVYISTGQNCWSDDWSTNPGHICSIRSNPQRPAFAFMVFLSFLKIGRNGHYKS